MTSDIFIEFFKPCNERMRHQERKMILFLVSATSTDLHLNNIKNTTSVLLKLDQGILQNEEIDEGCDESEHELEIKTHPECY